MDRGDFIGLSQALVQSHILANDLEVSRYDPSQNLWMTQRPVRTVSKDAVILSNWGHKQRRFFLYSYMHSYTTASQIVVYI